MSMQAIMVTLIFIILSLSFLYGYESFFKASFYMDMGHPLIYISPPPVLKFQKKQWVNSIKKEFRRF
jgi:hypothetical protein